MTDACRIEMTDAFARWLQRLKDASAFALIMSRLARVRRHAHFGDCVAVGEGVSEMRVHVGPGYRVYFTRRGDSIVVLLYGGDKSSQSRDIARAKLLAAEVRKS